MLGKSNCMVMSENETCTHAVKEGAVQQLNCCICMHLRACHSHAYLISDIMNTKINVTNSNDFCESNLRGHASVIRIYPCIVWGFISLELLFVWNWNLYA